MKTLIMFMLVAGCILMQTDIVVYVLYMLKGRDVVSGKNKRDKIRLWLGLGLLLFFMLGYLVVLLSKSATLMVAGILFGGSIYVLIMLIVMFGLLKSAKQSSMQVSELLVDMIETRDANLSGHSHYVQNIVRLFHGGLPDDLRHQVSLVSLEYAALMHNIGNISIPETILSKSEKLTDKEWELIKQHPHISAGLLERLHSFDEVREWILYHHERVDGAGYYQIPEERIPLPSKILAIADTYAALTSRRSFRAKRDHEEAMRIIRENAGLQFDEQLVEYFCRLPQDQLRDCRPKPLDLLEKK